MKLILDDFLEDMIFITYIKAEHCFVLGCGQETLAYWVRDETGLSINPKLLRRFMLRLCSKNIFRMIKAPSRHTKFILKNKGKIKMSRIKAWNHDKMMSQNESGDVFMGDDSLFYQDVRTGRIFSLAEWKSIFSAANNPCKWYNCKGKDCDHPTELEPGECFLVEVEIVGHDHDGSPIWENV